jgi:hypothetical protein
MPKQLTIKCDATTQVITIDDGDGGAVSLYPATVPYVVSQLMAGAVALGLGLDYPAPKSDQPITFKN